MQKSAGAHQHKWTVRLKLIQHGERSECSCNAAADQPHRCCITDVSCGSAAMPQLCRTSTATLPQAPRPDWARPQPPGSVCAHACLDVCQFLVCLNRALVALGCWRPCATSLGRRLLSQAQRGAPHPHRYSMDTGLFRPSPVYCHSSVFTSGHGRAAPLNAAHSRPKPLPGGSARMAQSPVVEGIAPACSSCRGGVQEARGGWRGLAAGGSKQACDDRAGRSPASLQQLLPKGFQEARGSWRRRAPAGVQHSCELSRPSVPPEV